MEIIAAWWKNLFHQNSTDRRPAFIGDAQRLTLKPGDTIVISCVEAVSRERAESMRAHVKEVWPNNKCVVLDRGSKIGVMGPDA